ncbi:MAG: hypothetical protein V3U80_09260 [Flavobacteriaceae bacterium]
MEKISKIFKIIIPVIGVIAAYLLYKVSILKVPTLNTSKEEADVLNAALNDQVAPFMGLTKWMLILVGLLIVAFIIWDVIKHPKNLKRTIIGIVAFVALYFISTLFAGSEQVIATDGKMLAEEGSKLSKRVSTGIVLSAILGIIAFGGFIFDSLKSLFK